MTTKFMLVQGVHMTEAAARNVEETGVNVQSDLRALRNGMSLWELRFNCLSGADADRVQGWEDYVDALELETIP